MFTLAEGRWVPAGWSAPDVAMLPDGSVVAVNESGAWQLTPDGRRSRIPGLSGTGISAGSGGSALVLQGGLVEPFPGAFERKFPAHRVLRWSSSDGATVVAGTGDAGLGGDGGPATAALLNLGASERALDRTLLEPPDPPTGIAALPGGGFAFTDTGNGRIRGVDPDGIIETIADAPPAGLRDPVGLAAMGDGRLLVSESGWPGRGRRGKLARVLWVNQDGTMQTVDGLCCVRDVAVTADGSAVLANGPFVWRLPVGGKTPEPILQPKDGIGRLDFAGRPRPEAWRIGSGSRGDLLLVSTTLTLVPAGPTPWTRIAFRALRPDPRGVTAVVETTQPGTVTLDLADGERVVASSATQVAVGHTTVRAKRGMRADWYDVRVALEGSSGLSAGDEIPFHGARALTVPLARSILGRYQGRASDFDGSYWLGSDCRRLSRRRVDCRIVYRAQRSRPGLTVGFASVRLRPSGVVLRRDYASSHVQRHPARHRLHEIQRLSRDDGGRWVD